MLNTQLQIIIPTPGRGLHDITENVKQILNSSTINCGLINIFIHHTSASLLINENYDPLVLADLEAFMLRLIPDGDALFKHVEEGPDDMPAHVRSALTTSTLTLPITAGKLALGTYQAIYLWEHRLKPYERKLTLTLQGS